MDKKLLIIALMVVSFFILLFDIEYSQITNRFQTIEQELPNDYWPVVQVFEGNLARNDTFYKNLLIRALYNKISICSNGSQYYYSDMNNLNLHSETFSNFKFYILDMDGDGIPEVGIEAGWLELYKYDSDDDVLQLWRKSWHEKPLGNGQMLYYNSSAANVIYYKHIILDAYGEETYRISFDRYDANGNTEMDAEDKFFVNNVEVSQEQWELLISYLFELEKNTPEPLSYWDLLQDLDIKQ